MHVAAHGLLTNAEEIKADINRMRDVLTPVVTAKLTTDPKYFGRFKKSDKALTVKDVLNRVEVKKFQILNFTDRQTGKMMNTKPASFVRYNYTNGKESSRTPRQDSNAAMYGNNNYKVNNSGMNASGGGANWNNFTPQQQSFLQNQMNMMSQQNMQQQGIGAGVATGGIGGSNVMNSGSATNPNINTHPNMMNQMNSAFAPGGVMTGMGGPNMQNYSSGSQGQTPSNGDSLHIGPQQGNMSQAAAATAGGGGGGS